MAESPKPQVKEVDSPVVMPAPVAEQHQRQTIAPTPTSKKAKRKSFVAKTPPRRSERIKASPETQKYRLNTPIRKHTPNRHLPPRAKIRRSLVVAKSDQGHASATLPSVRGEDWYGQNEDGNFCQTCITINGWCHSHKDQQEQFGFPANKSVKSEAKKREIDRAKPGPFCYNTPRKQRANPDPISTLQLNDNNNDGMEDVGDILLAGGGSACVRTKENVSHATNKKENVSHATNKKKGKPLALASNKGMLRAHKVDE